MRALADLASRWPRLSGLLDEALDQPPDARAAWLDRRTDTPTELKDTLRRLLAAQPRASTGDFLSAPPPLQLAVPTDGALSEGMTVGPYRLLRELGQGGMGSVWLAERSDGQMKRQVALKLPHLVWGGNLGERLARERNILATLEHPHIARLYDAGVDALGRPWMAMEYVQGVAIDAYARERQLDIPARLALLLQVCSAVAYAHSRLVIHRDLKPSNILVTDDGQVRLLDFGIAKLVHGESAEATALTRAAGHALTPEYASPEQVRRQALSTSSDVYSLGVVAFELLSEHKPYQLKRGTAAELEEAVVAADVPRASVVATDTSMARCLRGDLDAILNKALKKAPEDRYPSVEALAEEFVRYLKQEPVQAQPDRATYRLAKFMRRNRLPVLAATAAFTALTSALVATAWQARRASEHAQRAEEVKQFVLSMFVDADTGAGGGHRATTSLDLLKRAQERLATMKDADPSVTSELMRSVGDSLIGLGELTEAQRVLDDALTLARTHHGEGHLLTAQARLAVGELLMERGRHTQAEPHLESAAADLRALGRRRELTNALRWLANLRSFQGRPDEQVRLAQEAASLADTLPTTDLRSRMLAQQTLTTALVTSNRPAKTVPARRAYDLARRIHGERITVDVVSTRVDLAYATLLDGEVAAAATELEALLPQQAALLGADHPAVALTLGRTGNAALALGDATAAAERYARAHDVLRRNQPGDPPSINTGLYKLLEGAALINAGRPGEGDERVERAIQMLLPHGPMRGRRLGSRARAARGGEAASGRSGSRASHCRGCLASPCPRRQARCSVVAPTPGFAALGTGPPG
jgi:eukaryotic-like serine/threonine-protein kinase